MRRTDGRMPYVQPCEAIVRVDFEEGTATTGDGRVHRLAPPSYTPLLDEDYPDVAFARDRRKGIRTLADGTRVWVEQA